MNREIDAGPWEVDERGRHFRRIGKGHIEYMPTITTTYGEFEIDSVPPPPKVVEPPRPKSWGDCPFVSKCTPQCALYGETGCGLVTGEGPTIDKRCPFGDKQMLFVCKEGCALWSLCNHQKEKKQ